MSTHRDNFKPDLYVVSRIIKSLMEDGPLTKTNLSVSAGISYDTLIEYMQWMISRDLLQENDGQVSITNKGASFEN